MLKGLGFQSPSSLIISGLPFFWCLYIDLSQWSAVVKYEILTVAKIRDGGIFGLREVC